MVGRRVALLCIDPLEESLEDFHPFNYSVRRVQAGLVARGIETHIIESRSKDIEPFLAQIAEVDPDIIGASAYVWSFPSFVEIARRVKERRPDTIIVFGGPSARAAMFELPPFREHRMYIDALVEGEAEDTFADIVTLATLNSDILATVPGVVVPTREGFRRGPPAILPDLNSLPSPYALNLVSPGVSAHLETFRGCPLACAFCQWGDSTGGNRIFSSEYIASELLHFRRLGLPDAMLVDAGLNLNARAFRALVEAERQVRVLKDIQLTFEVYPSFLKDEHLQFMSDIRVNGVGVGLQSYDTEVLRRLQRTFDIARFERVIRDLDSIGVQVNIEIIMGLPGDNPESFRETLARARELPCDVRAFHCLVLPDALMVRAPPWAAMDFEPTTLLMRSCAGWSERDINVTRDELSRSATDAGGWSQGTFWVFPQEARRGVNGPAEFRRPPAEREVSEVHVPEVRNEPSEAETAFMRDAMATIARESAGQWSLRSVEHENARCTLCIDIDGILVTLDLVTAVKGTPSFVVADGVSISYRPPARPLHKRDFDMLRTMSPALAALFKKAAPRDSTVQRRLLPVVSA